MERSWSKIKLSTTITYKLGEKYDNLEPILDMVQDIEIPNHNDLIKKLQVYHQP